METGPLLVVRMKPTSLRRRHRWKSLSICKLTIPTFPSSRAFFINPILRFTRI
jgi:hypothetical protein